MPNDDELKKMPDLQPNLSQDKVERRRQFYRSFEAQALKNRSFFTRIADDLTNAFGSVSFLILNIIWFAVWILINTGLVATIPPFDPFPFGLLTMIVSLEAIFLAIIILVSQNRTSYVDTIREELHLQVNLIAEEEITKVLKLLSEMRVHMGIKEKDVELDEMIKRTNTSYIERSLINQIEKAHTTLTKKIVNKLKSDFPDILNPLSNKK
jgi:uncharacterized membrane protein